MKLSEIKDKLMVSTISKKGDVITIRKTFFYRMDKTTQTFIDRVKTLFPNAEIIDSGEVWKPFRGGASTANSSHWFVSFKLCSESSGDAVLEDSTSPKKAEPEAEKNADSKSRQRERELEEVEEDEEEDE